MKSLVSVEPQPSGPYRYRLLEVLRQYGAECLEQCGEASRMRRRHAEYFLNLYQVRFELGRTKSSSGQSEADNANIAAALHWCVTNGRAHVRPAARVILLDPLHRVLLFRNQQHVPSDPEQPEIVDYWFTPGGGVAPGENFAEAALRELREETGITNVRLGPCVWIRQGAGFMLGKPVLGDERYFLAYTEHTSVDPSGMHPEELFDWREFRWWTLAQLRSTAETIFPNRFVDYLEPLLEGDVPSVPIRIYGNRAVQDAIAAAQSKSVPATDTPLTPRELDVVKLIARGYTNRQIAEQLVIATSTAERHVANILSKLELSSRTQLVRWAMSNGGLDHPLRK